MVGVQSCIMSISFLIWYSFFVDMTSTFQIKTVARTLQYKVIRTSYQEYKLWLLNNDTHLQNIYLKKITIEMSPFRVLSLSLDRSMRIFNCWKQYCRTSSDKPFIWVPSLFLSQHQQSQISFLSFKWYLTLRSRKSQSGPGQASAAGAPTYWARNEMTGKALCAGALSWWRIHELFVYISGHVVPGSA